MSRQVTADFRPVVARIVGAHYVPALLHKEHARPLRIHRDVVNTAADAGVRIGNVSRLQSAIDRSPLLAATIGAESARGANRNPHALRITRIKNDRVQAHAACTRLPLWSRSVSTEPRKLLPVLAPIGRAENRRVFNSCVDGVGIGERRLQMPYPFELPGMLRAVVPLVRGERRSRRVISKFVARRLRRTRFRWLSGGRSRLMPGFAAVLGPLN